VHYISRKKGFPYSGVFPRLIALASDLNERLEVLPLMRKIAQVIHLVPRDDLPDMPDRVVTVTAVAHKLSLMSQDAEIRTSASPKTLALVIW
jgi:hypothetical protein